MCNVEYAHWHLFFTLYMVWNDKRREIEGANWTLKDGGKKEVPKKIFSEKNHCRPTHFTDTDWFYETRSGIGSRASHEFYFRFFATKNFFLCFLVFGIRKVFLCVSFRDRKVLKPLHRTPTPTTDQTAKLT